MKNNSNSEEKVKLKTGAKGRPKEVTLKEGKEEKKKTNKDRYGSCLCNATYMMLLIARNELEEKFGVTVDNEDFVIYLYSGENWNDVNSESGDVDLFDGEIVIQKKCKNEFYRFANMR